MTVLGWCFLVYVLLFGSLLACEALWYFGCLDPMDLVNFDYPWWQSVANDLGTASQ